ncbi:MAG TPA: response regulator, partial [Candidatus Polarisedimenticolia bacterium]|nr:response regulator [Candidatus Polarisedimenticolia bacterium]
MTDKFRTTAESGSASILVIDDEPVLLELLGTVLREAGYTVATAEDGRSAVEMVRQTRFQ